MELNREKTIEALECLQDEDRIFCNQKCYYYDYLCKTYHCERAVGRDALALINLQEQRIGELEKRLRYLLQSKTIAEYDEVDIHTKEYVKDIHSLDANIKGLTEENERLENICQSYALQYGTATDKEVFLKKERADTVRKMQERLDKRFCHDPAFLGVEQRLIMDVIDQIAKEMLEDAD